MVDYESDDDDPKASRFSLRAFLIRDWPYFAMLWLLPFSGLPIRASRDSR